MTSSWLQRALESFRIGRVNRRRRRSFAAPTEPLEYRLLLTTRFWDGGSVTSDQWTNRFNWEGNIRPNSGDDLVFPDSIRFTDRGLNNDFPVGTQFNNITFEGEGYLIRGNAILLSGDITYAPRSVIALSHTHFNLDIKFSDGNHRITLVAGAVPTPELEFHSRLTDDGAGDIIFSGDGNVILSGDVANNIDTHTIVLDNPGVDESINSFQTRLTLAKPDNVKAIVGPLEIGNNAVVIPERRVQVDLDDELRIGQIDRDSPVTVRDGGSLNVAVETLRDLTLNNGTVTIRRRVTPAINPNNNPVDGALTLGGTVSVGSGSGAIQGFSVDGGDRPRIQLGSETTFDVAVGGTLRIFDTLAGGDLIKNGRGSLELKTDKESNLHGDTVINDGRLFLLSPVAGRTTIPHDLIVGPGAQVFHNKNSNQIADTAAVRINGGKFTQSGNLDGVPVDETIGSLTLNAQATFTVSGEDVDLDVLGTVEIRGASTFKVVAGGNATVDEDAILAGNSQLTVEDGARATFLDTIRLDRSTATANEASLRFRDDVVVVGGFLRSIGTDGTASLTGNLFVNPDANQSAINGKLQLTSGDHIFSVGDGDAANDLVINAIIDDGSNGFGQPASITKTGDGRMLLTRNNTYRGTTTINLGTLIVNGNHSLDQGEFIVNGGILTGQGRVREIVQSAGVLNPGFGIGFFTAAESTFLGDQSRFVVQINGATVGTQFDQLKTGQLVLGSAAHPKLDVRLGFTPNVGQSFRIVLVTGNTLLPANQFFRDLQGNDLPEGASFLVDGLSFTITYKGGNGNDVVITRNTPPAFENITITPEIIEGQSVVVTGHITEPDPLNTFFLDVNWGDGSAAQTFRFAPGSPRDIRVWHRYLDDPDGPNDRYRVTLHWRDQFGGTNGANLTTIVRNAAPKILGITASLPPLKVGRPIIIQGLISDRSPSDSFKVFIQWSANGPWQAVNLPAGSTSFSFQHTYARIGQYQVTVKVIDDDLDFHELNVVLNVV